MENKFTNSWSFPCVLVVAIIIVGLQYSAADVPPVFLFGDSTLDVGTNNFLPVSPEIRADFPSNGIDYPYSIATGRFCNGYNTADQIVRLMGYKRSPPAFLALLNRSSSFKKRLLQGVNFASGGSGILDATGLYYRNPMSLGEQIKQFSSVHDNMTEVMGPENTCVMLSKSLFIISAGSNDVFAKQRSGGVLSPQFLANLQSTYRNHFKSLYDLGARKFGIISIPPIGCTPAERFYNGTGGCLEDANDFAKKFHNATDNLLQQLSSELKGMKYSLGNSFEMTMTLIENPYAFGIKEINSACCGDATQPCNQSAKSLCQNRDDYLFWDRFHPTQRTAELGALTLFGGSERFVKPVNFSRLIDFLF